MFIQEGIVVFASPFKQIQTRKGTVVETQSVVLEYDDGGNFKKRVAFDSNKEIPFQFSPGRRVTVCLSVDASEYNGKWYNRVKCVGVVLRSSPDKYRSSGSEQQAPYGEQQVSASDFDY